MYSHHVLRLRRAVFSLTRSALRNRACLFFKLILMSSMSFGVNDPILSPHPRIHLRCHYSFAPAGIYAYIQRKPSTPGGGSVRARAPYTKEGAGARLRGTDYPRFGSSSLATLGLVLQQLRAYQRLSFVLQVTPTGAL